MSNTTTILAIMVAVLIICLFPLMLDANKKNDVTTNAVQAATNEFTTKLRTTGIITRENYDNFIYTLGATGEAYDVEITVQRIDENYAKKASKNGGTTIGDNVYLTEYNTQVMDTLNSLGKYQLYGGDIIIVNVKNTNKTIADQIKNVFYNIKLTDSPAIVASASGLVVGGKTGITGIIASTEGSSTDPSNPGDTPTPPSTESNEYAGIEFPTEVERGKTYEIYFKVTGEGNGVDGGIQAYINYDKDVIELISAQCLPNNWSLLDDELQYINPSGNNKFVVKQDTMGDDSTNIKGILQKVVKFEIKVKDDAAYGNTQVIFSRIRFHSNGTLLVIRDLTGDIIVIGGDEEPTLY